MANVRIKLKSSGMEAMLKSAGVRSQLDGPAEAVLAAAIADAPVKTGNYRDSLHIEDDTTDRAVKRIVASAPHAHLVEAQSGTLARALDAAG